MKFSRTQRKEFPKASPRGTKNLRATIIRLLQGFLCIAVLSVIIWAVLRYFTVQTIECTEAGRPCSANVLTFFSGWKNTYIFQDFEFAVPTKKGTVTKKFPHTLVVTIDTPIVVLHVYTDAQKQQSAAVYSDGSIVKDVDTSVAKDQKVTLIDEELLKATSVSLERLRSYQVFLDQTESLTIDQVHYISDGEIEITTKRNITAIVSLEKLSEELRSLQLVLASPTIEQKPARVDFRFERPVLRYL